MFQLLWTFDRIERWGPWYHCALDTAEIQRICEKFEAICDEYNIKDKLDYIISDNAANMRKAFTVCFPTEQGEEHDDDDGDHLDNPELWHNLT